MNTTTILGQEATMKAVIQDRYGTSEVLRVGEVPIPEPSDREVLIKVHAAGLDRGTEHLMTGKPYAMRMATGLRRPRNPISGRDVAGTVVKVGSAVTRFAPGDEVYGVASAAKADFVRSLGADHVLDYKRDDFADGTRQYDLILDIGGGASLSRLRRALKRRGTVVFVGSENTGNITGMGRQFRGAVVSLFVPQRLALLLAKERASDLEQLTEHLEAGRITPALADTYSLEQAKDAMMLLEDGKVRGKVVIVPRHPARGDEEPRHTNPTVPA